MKRWDRKSHPIYAQLKYDGINIRISPDGRCVSRNNKDWTFKLHEIECIDKARSVCNSEHCDVGGELYLPGGKCSDVITAVKEKNPNLKFGVFYMDDGEDYWLHELQEWCDEVGLEAIPYLCHWASLRDSFGKDVNFRENKHPDMWAGCIGGFADPESEMLLGWVKSKGRHIEGFVVCDSMLGEHQKIKTFEEMDLVVMDTKPGKNSNSGVIGSLICGCEGIELAKVGSISDQYRQMSEEEWIGKVVEVRFAHMGNKGKLFHPRLVRIREDKDEEQCTLDQCEEVQKFHSSNS